MRFKPPVAFVLAGAILSAAMIFSAASSPAKGKTYVNPVLDENFPDPSLLKVGGLFYAYATNTRPEAAGPRRNMQCARSADLIHWTLLPDAMPVLPGWAKPGRTWAPQVRALPGGGYAAYFTAWDAAADQQVVGVAVSAAPEGPFISSPLPLITQPDEGGAIDASCFLDPSGERYLVWKNDGNSRGRDTWLWIQKLTADGLHLAGTPTKMIKQDQPWEGNLVEAPTLWKHGAKYYLFYSANAFVDCRYAVGYAVADSILGPYVKPHATPWLASTDGVCGPGGEDIVATRDGSTWMAYHTWAKGPHSYRSMSIDRLHWVGDVPVLDGPSHSPQPVPALP